MSTEFLAIVMAVVCVTCIITFISLPKLQEANHSKRINRILVNNKDKKSGSSSNLISNDIQAKRKVINEFREGENSKSVRLLRRGQELLKSNDALQSSNLRFKLAQAGYRGTRPIATYILFRMIAPPIMGVLTAVYIYFFLPHIAESNLRYTLFILASVVIGFYLPVLWLKNKKTKRQASIIASYPDMLDLVLICTESGMSAELAFRRVAEEIGHESPALREELETLTAELSYLNERRLAYDNFAKRTDLPQVRALASIVTQAEQYGTPVSHALRILSEESRDERTSEAERKAAALPSKLTVPMMLFFMPVLFIVIMTPAALQITDNL